MAKLVLTGDGRGAVKAVRDLNKELAGTAKASVLTAKEAAKVVRQAKSIGEAADPLKKYNRLMKELADHVRQGRVSMQDASRMAVTYRQRLEGVGKAGSRAFGSQALSGIRSMAVQYISVSAAISVVTAGLRELAQERERAAQAGIESRGGLGALAQLAATEKSPKAAYARLLAEARSIRSQGGAGTEGEAGDLLFGLVSAGLGRTDRNFAVKLKSSGVMSSPDDAAKAFSAISANLGRGEVGSFEQFISKSLAASRLAPAQASQISLGASRAGGSAKALGLSDESLLAAAAILAKSTGTAERGGTQLAAFLKGVEKAKGLETKGKNLGQIVELIGSLPEAQQGFGGVLKDRAEGIEAFRTLKNNIDLLSQLTGEITAAQASGMAQTAIGLPGTDTRVAAAKMAVRAKASREVGMGMEGSAGNLVDALVDERALRRRTESPGVITEFLNGLEQLSVRMNRFTMTNESMLRSELGDPEVTKTENNRIANMLQQIEQNQKTGNPQGRQE